MHHIADTVRFAAVLYGLLPVGGRIALADLDTESSDFHADNTGVEHFGFDRAELTRIFSGTGFQDVRMETAYEFVRLLMERRVSRFSCSAPENLLLDIAPTCSHKLATSNSPKGAASSLQDFGWSGRHPNDESRSPENP